MNLKRIFGRIQCELERFVTTNYSNQEAFSGYTKVIDKRTFSIYRANDLREVIIAAFHSIVVTKKSYKKRQYIYIYPVYTKKWIRYKIELNTKNFPGLLPNSKIMNCLLVPFIREVSKDKFYKRWRLIVFTDKCQVYHNFPNRDSVYDGFEEYGDIKRFEESVVWDVPGRKYPSMTKEHSDVEFFFPFLKDECYEYHPEVNKKSKYGNKGFNKDNYVKTKDNKLKKVCRFYFPNRQKDANPFFYMGGIELDYKMSLIGTYQSNKTVGARTVIFATSDGGRNWFAKIEFADEGEYIFRQGSKNWGYNFGNIINGLGYKDYAGKAYVKKKIIIYNGKENKVIFEESKKIKKIYGGKRVKIETETEHNLSTGNIILLEGDIHNGSNLLTYLFDCGDKSKLYKVEVINKYTFFIYECVSNPFNSLPCRHVHHINRVRDGWIIGTGEIFPNGWLLFMQMQEADTYSIKKASDYFKCIQLNTSSNSVQRTIGADIIDSNDPMLIFASDHDLLDRGQNLLENGVKITRNSTGIYSGKLSDIDDFKKFQVIYEAKEPAYFFKKLDNRYVFSGQRGEIAISNEDKTYWETSTLDGPMIHLNGSTYSFYVIDKYLLVLK